VVQTSPTIQRFRLPAMLRRLLAPLRGGWGTAIVLLLIWEAAVWAFGIKDYLLPAPSEIALELRKRWPRVVDGAWITGIEILVGYLVGIAVSIPLAMGIAFSPWMERNVYPVIVTIQVVPKIALAPLFVVWVGIGLFSKVLMVFLLCFFPMLVNNVAGFRGANPEVMEFARSTGAGLWRMFRMIRLPAALPSIFTGLKIGAVNSVTGAIVAEFVASDRGLGYLLLEYNGNMQTGAVFATVVLVSAVGLTLYYLVELVERLSIPWHVSQRGSGREAASDR
jgi:NitT/TauT family transport system permease protein